MRNQNGHVTDDVKWPWKSWPQHS